MLHYTLTAPETRAIYLHMRTSYITIDQKLTNDKRNLIGNQTNAPAYILTVILAQSAGAGIVRLFPDVENNIKSIILHTSSKI